jgi:putative redox protein
MVEVRVRYEGDLRCVAEHVPSQARLSSDAPTDNHGRGETFSPTDLIATALGTCMLTVMGILARQRGYRIEGIEVTVEKHMTTSLPRKIARLAVRFAIPTPIADVLDADARAALLHAAETCPVRLSIHERIEVPVSFDW